MYQYFTDIELRCRCCGALVIDTTFRIRLNLSRSLAGFPFIVDSGHRCEKHNRDEGSTSQNHVVGKAADIRCFDDSKRFRMVKAMIEAGMLGIGIGPKYVHCDINRALGHIWTY
jgi:uncharacterized protein YcbK (DUF882 family)